jgi:hypothetical protein
MFPPPARQVVLPASRKCGVEAADIGPGLLLADQSYKNLYTEGVTDVRQTLVPAVISSRSERKIRHSSPRDTEQTFFEKLEAQAGREAATTAADLKAWIRPLVSYLWWGSGSMIPTLEIRGGRDCGGAHCYYFAVRTNGKVELQFGYLKGKPGFKQDGDLVELISRLNQIPGLSLPTDSFKFPSTLQLASVSRRETCGADGLGRRASADPLEHRPAPPVDLTAFTLAPRGRACARMGCDATFIPLVA